MALQLRSTVQGREPTAGNQAGQIREGQIALNINENEPFLCFLDRTGVVRRIGVKVGTTAPATPTAGELWCDTSGSSPVLRCYVSAALGWTTGGGGGGTAGDGFPSGTRLIFQQTSPPTGWVKDTSLDNRALRVVAGVVGSGGNLAFTAAFANRAFTGSTDATVITVAQMPAHGHGINDPGHSHGVTDPGHSHGIHDPGHAHGTRYTGVRVVGDSPTDGQNEQSHVRQIYEENVWTGTSGANLGINGNTTGVTINGGGANISLQNNGGGQGHSHGLSGGSLNMAVAYTDVIVAQKV